MPPRQLRPDDVILQPGEYFVGGGCRVRTVLGSCVSITLWAPRQRLGAMSHFLLASRPATARRAPDARYGDEALDLMLRELGRAGITPGDCEAKIFGGGDMFPRQRGGALPIGLRNGEAARALLAARGIAVRTEHLFGLGHRHIVFETDTGAVWVRQPAPGELRESP
ncbi:chemotaxis protein CheD [Xylophilus sp. GW821-FHT01B05]